MKELITKIIQDLKEGKIDSRIEKFIDYKNKYTILRPTVKVEVELTDGKVAVVDVTDYFTEVLNNAKEK